MENIHIETTQNVTIDYELASLGERILATLLDYLFFLAYFFIYAIIASSIHSLGNTIVTVLLLLPILLYDLLCEQFFHGQSFGKMIVKIKVVKLDGTQATFSAYLLRWLLRIVDTKILTGAIAIIVILVNGKGQRVGDLAAGTTVIKLNLNAALKDTIISHVKPDYVPVFREVNKLSDNDIFIIREALKISVENNNIQAIEKLADKTKSVMGVTTDINPAQFLETVLKDYTNYEFDKGVNS